MSPDEMLHTLWHGTPLWDGYSSDITKQNGVGRFLVLIGPSGDIKDVFYALIDSTVPASRSFLAPKWLIGKLDSDLSDSEISILLHELETAEKTFISDIKGLRNQC